MIPSVDFAPKGAKLFRVVLFAINMSLRRSERNKTEEVFHFSFQIFHWSLQRMYFAPADRDIHSLEVRQSQRSRGAQCSPRSASMIPSVDFAPKGAKLFRVVLFAINMSLRWSERNKTEEIFHFSFQIFHFSSLVFVHGVLGRGDNKMKTEN
jgi:hypothetical protein